MNMLEKAARAIAEADVKDIDPKWAKVYAADGWRMYLPMARFALQALNEPDEEMIRAMLRGWNGLPSDADLSATQHLSVGAWTKAWQAALKHILEQGE